MCVCGGGGGGSERGSSSVGFQLAKTCPPPTPLLLALQYSKPWPPPDIRNLPAPMTHLIIVEWFTGLIGLNTVIMEIWTFIMDLLFFLL